MERALINFQETAAELYLFKLQSIPGNVSLNIYLMALKGFNWNLRLSSQVMHFVQQSNRFFCENYSLFSTSASSKIIVDSTQRHQQTFELKALCKCIKCSIDVDLYETKAVEFNPVRWNVSRWKV